MAAPTKQEENYTSYRLYVTGTNIDAGNNDYPLEYTHVNLSKGFSIITGTLTNCNVTVLADNGTVNPVDVTTDLTGVAVLSSDSAYLVDVPAPVKRLIIRVAQTNATNAVNFVAFAPKR